MTRTAAGGTAVVLVGVAGAAEVFEYPSHLVWIAGIEAGGGPAGDGLGVVGDVFDGDAQAGGGGGESGGGDGVRSWRHLGS